MIKINWSYHSHTNYTDGSDTVEGIARHCDKVGIKEIALTEHVTKEPDYDFDRLLLDMKLADDRFNVCVLSGIEAKILPDGTLDCPDDLNGKVDIVIGSVHSLNNMTEQEAYEKLAESDCMIIGHPQFVNEKVLTSMVKTGKIVELSGRYEQPDDVIKAFKEAGLMFSIGLYSHSLENLADFGKLEGVIERLDLQDRLWRFRP